MAALYRFVTERAAARKDWLMSGCGGVCLRLVFGSEVFRLRIESMAGRRES